MNKEINNQLSNRLEKDFESAKLGILKISSPYPSIAESLRRFSEFDIEQFKAKVRKDLLVRLIPAWLEHQEEDNVDKYDCILFEYSDQETPPYEAFSYGLYNMKDYKLTIEPHYFKYADHSAWGGGTGLLLEPFSICEPFHINVLGLNEEYEKIHYEDRNSGRGEVSKLANSICKMALNKVFSEADSEGVFSKLKLRSGGIFMYDMHDGGNVQNPFYFKN